MLIPSERINNRKVPQRRIKIRNPQRERKTPRGVIKPWMNSADEFLENHNPQGE
jgi:hypothetical protein